MCFTLCVLHFAHCVAHAFGCPHYWRFFITAIRLAPTSLLDSRESIDSTIVEHSVTGVLSQVTDPFTITQRELSHRAFSYRAFGHSACKENQQQKISSLPDSLRQFGAKEPYAIVGVFVLAQTFRPKELNGRLWGSFFNNLRLPMKGWQFKFCSSKLENEWEPNSWIQLNAVVGFT